MEGSLSKSDRLSIARFRHEKVKDSERRERNASRSDVRSTEDQAPQ
jgi:hypothetical protein